MIVRFDSLNRFEKPKMTICNPGSVYRNGATSNTVGMLVDTTDEEIVFNFNTTSTLSLRANLCEYDDPESNAYVQKVFNSLQNRRYIFLDDIGYFVITNTEDNNERGLRYKDITAESCEIEIRNKGLSYIENGTYRFDDLLDMVTAAIPKWTVKSVASTVSARYRTFEEVDYSKNTLAFLLEDVQDAYECIFVFDIVDRHIYVYDQSSYVVNTNIHITNENVMKHLKITENSDDLYTAVTALGAETITIAPVNPLGTSTIYNFDYYLDWMSEGLRGKVTSWSLLLAEKQPEYYDLNLSYYNALQAQTDAKSEAARLETVKDMYEKCRDNIVATSGTNRVAEYNEEVAKAGGTTIDISDDIKQTISHIDSLIADVNKEIASNNATLDLIEGEIAGIQASIDTIRDSVSFETYFSQAEYDELYDYIYEGNYNDSYVIFTDEMSYPEKFEQMKTLYDRTMMQLGRVSVPTQEFTADVESFIFAKEFLPWSEQLETGCLINVELRPDDVAALFLSSMTVNYADKNMSLTFGNRFNKFDPKTLFENALGNISKSANTIEYLKQITDPLRDGTFDAFAEAVRTSRTLTMNAALSSTNQDFEMDASGITGRKVLDDGTVDPRQVKIVNNSMVFTNDDWESVHTCIGEVILDDGTVVYGVNAETVIGEMIIGGELHIFDNNGTDIFTVMDNKIVANIADSESGMKTYVDVTAEGIRQEMTEADNGLSNTISNTASGLEQKISDLDTELSGQITEISATASGLSTKVATLEEGIETNSSNIKQNADNISAEVKNREDAVAAVDLRIDNIKLSVSNGASSSTVTLTSDDLSVTSPEIKFTGMVTFEDLLGDGKTEINGNNISTGRLDAENVGVTGALSVYNGKSATDRSGYVGYLSGDNGSSKTDGIGVSSDADHYLVATTNGVRMQAGDYTFFVTDNGSGSAGTHHKDYGYKKVLYSTAISNGGTATIDGLPYYDLFAVYLTPISGWANKTAPVIAMKSGNTLCGIGGLGANSPGTTDDCSELHFVNCSINGTTLTVNEAAISQVFSGGGTSAKQATSIAKIVGLI